MIIYVCTLFNTLESGITLRLPAAMPWLECGMVGDVMPYDRGRDENHSEIFYATIHSENMTHLKIILFSNWWQL
jgi:hypothetical protein